MGTLELSLTGYSSLNPVPGGFYEVRFAQGETGGNAGAKKVLLVGVKTGSGTATTDTQAYRLQGSGDAETYFGAGSKIHRMARRFFARCKNAEVWGIAAAESAGAAAASTVTFVNNATAAGSVQYTLCGETIEYAFASGATITAIALGLSNLINLQTHWPVTSSPAVGVITVTAKIKGTDGNWIRHRAVMTGSGIATTVTVAGTLFTAGATDEVWTTVLSTILATKYDYIVCGVNPTAAANVRLGALKTQVVAQKLPGTGIRQEIVYGTAASIANAVSLSAEATDGPGNQPVFSAAHQENSELEPMELAAEYMATRYLEEGGTTPWASYDNAGQGDWSVPKQYSSADWPTISEQSTLISGGVTPIAVNGKGQTYIVRAVTCSTDVRVRDTTKVSVSFAFVDALAQSYSNSPAKKLRDDLAADEVRFPPNDVMTPAKAKGTIIAPVYIRYAGNNWLDPVKTLNKTSGDITGCATGLDPLDPTQLNAIIPIHVTPVWHKFACLVTENSAG